MQYETAAQMAQRLGVTIRTVQLWAKSDRLPGAYKQGRDWLIPAGLKKPDKDGYSHTMERVPLPLINSEFTLGLCKNHIDTIAEDDIKNIALAEYYYFTGQVKPAAELTEIFFNHKDVIIKLSAYLIYSFSHLALGEIKLAELGLNCISESIKTEISDNATPQFRAACILVSTTASVLMHEKASKKELIEHIRYLPRGLQLWSGYILSHMAFLDGEYEWAIGILETLFAIPAVIFPIPMIYLHISASMSLMSLKRIDEAKAHFNKAWALAEKDGFIQPFVEHNGLLFGLVENCVKWEYPQKYKEIEKLTLNFTSGWRTVHNNRMNKEISASLSTSEFAISMLASRGWSNLEIADYMGYSLHTVKRYISIIYQKLGITSRSELKRFIHQ